MKYWLLSGRWRFGPSQKLLVSMFLPLRAVCGHSWKDNDLRVFKKKVTARQDVDVFNSLSAHSLSSSCFFSRVVSLPTDRTCVLFIGRFFASVLQNYMYNNISCVFLYAWFDVPFYRHSCFSLLLRDAQLITLYLRKVGYIRWNGLIVSSGAFVWRSG